MADYDLVIKGGNLVIPHIGVVRADVGVQGEKIASIDHDIPASRAAQVVDASGLHVFPGVVDTHSHIGIYRPLEQDACTESACAASGGVTTILSYFRTGKNYLGKVGPFKEIWPELMEKSNPNFIIDYGYHIAIMTPEQLAEVPWLMKECGVPTLKYYMFYKTLDLSGSSDSSSYLINKTSLDFGFVYRLMKAIALVNREYGSSGPGSLSVHCENPEMIPVTTEEVKAAPSGNETLDYSNSRPPWLEELAIVEVGTMAKWTGCPVNLLHLTSVEAVDAAKREYESNRGLPILLECTLHHLSMHSGKDYGVQGKVNPPIRSQRDVDYLWESLIKGDIRTVVSDHACIMSELKQGGLWKAMPGFGGTNLFFPVLISEGYYKRGFPLHKIAEAASYNPARHFHLFPRKGNLAVGFDADMAVVDLEAEKEITLEVMNSASDVCPFLGERLKGWNVMTVSRGEVIYRNGEVTGRPGRGHYLKRS